MVQNMLFLDQQIMNRTVAHGTAYPLSIEFFTAFLNRINCFGFKFLTMYSVMVM